MIKLRDVQIRTAKISIFSISERFESAIPGTTHRCPICGKRLSGKVGYVHYLGNKLSRLAHRDCIEQILPALVERDTQRARHHARMKLKMVYKEY